ncbi:hypothetical protein MMYC01_201286 [Madurella mycetomatis]|uniref:Uncharacterized protein n=1 Tax=Madurella mycetomatis TaxID=100816 RepID=A0A175WFA7_9PEZI|nr:hypothetical protein MMYC01_201286 [Madurella mycetomatis]
MGYKLYSARTPEDLLARSEEHNGIQVVSQLSRADLVAPASRWTSRHLVAYRLLTHPKTNFLPTLETDHNEQCPLCRTEQPCSQELDYANIDVLLGETPRALCTKSEGELMRLSGGAFWAALARAAHPEIADEAKAYPRRDRSQVERPGYVNSASAILGSSSPTQPSSSEFEGDMGDLDEDMHEERRNKPEEVTVHLVTRFLQHTLSLCLVQRPSIVIKREEVRFRVERKKTTAYIGSAPVTAEDDGGICLMRQNGVGWEMVYQCLAILEAKRAFQHIRFEERSGNYTPTVSNAHLAQYLGEAVVTWKDNQEYLANGVFLIAATSTFIRFIHFTFGRDYMEYLDAPDQETQIDLANDDERDAFAYMHSTDWFNLQLPEGRRIALCHILALVRWHAGDVARQAASGLSADDHMDIQE